MAVAFIAGMFITAALAQTPAAADIFSLRAVPALPAAPDAIKANGSPGTGNPVKPGRNALVCLTLVRQPTLYQGGRALM